MSGFVRVGHRRILLEVFFNALSSRNGHSSCLRCGRSQVLCPPWPLAVAPDPRPQAAVGAHLVRVRAVGAGPTWVCRGQLPREGRAARPTAAVERARSLAALPPSQARELEVDRARSSVVLPPTQAPELEAGRARSSVVLSPTQAPELEAGRARISAVRPRQVPVAADLATSDPRGNDADKWTSRGLGRMRNRA